MKLIGTRILKSVLRSDPDWRNKKDIEWLYQGAEWVIAIDRRTVPPHCASIEQMYTPDDTEEWYKSNLPVTREIAQELVTYRDNL